MKVGFIEPHLKVFGGIRRIVEMANRLHGRGHDVTIYHSDGSPCTWLECRARVAPGRDVLGERHDIVLYNDPEPEDMYLAAHAPARVTFYYTLGLYRKELMAGFAAFHPTLLMGRNKRTRRLRRCLRSGHQILVNSTWMQRWLRDHMRIDADLLIGGVNTDLFYPAPERLEARDADGPLRVLCSGDPRPGKGTETIVHAVDIVRDGGVDVTLDTYHGKDIAQSDMARIYSSAHVFADATYNNGGWNNAVAEAMACGVAVACCSNGQVEDFAFHGKTALLSPPHDASAMADNIVRLAREAGLRQRLAAAALDHIHTFDWERSIDRFEAIAAKYLEAAR